MRPEILHVTIRRKAGAFRMQSYAETGILYDPLLALVGHLVQDYQMCMYGRTPVP